MGKKSYFAAILVIAVLCLSFAVVMLTNNSDIANAADNTSAAQINYSTVAVHDPSIVLAYEDADGNTYGEQNAQKTRTKVYYSFGTQIANAKSYDLINWTSFSNNLNNANNLYELLGDAALYSGLTVDTVVGNSWAPDVIWNKDLQKWCMYLSVNGSNHNSSIVMLMADNLDGVWSYAGTVVWSGFTSSNVGSTDYEKVMGTTTINGYHNITDSNGYISYAAHSIDPCVFYDEDGELWMSYGSWRGGIFLLKLDNYTGVRDYDYKYTTRVNGTPANGSTQFTVYEDQYFGKHIAGGAGSSGEGSYIVYNNGYYYLFITYGALDPKGGYNMRYFRSDTVDGSYVDANGDTALYNHVSDGGTPFGTNNLNGIRVMSGYTWSWWDYTYIAQGHNSVFVDDDGKMYIVYHNKYTDGTLFHVMKVHQLLNDGNNWLVAAPFEAKSTDTYASDKFSEIEGTYGAFIMTFNNGTHDYPCKESKIKFESNGTVSGDISGKWKYAANGKITLTISGKTYMGYILNQTMEGTNIQTLSIGALDKTNGETFWAYKYPSEITAGAYARSGIAVPENAQLDKLTSSFSNTDNIWYNTTVTMTKNESGYSGSDGSSVQIGASTDNYAEFASVNYGQNFIAMPGVSGGFSISFDYSNYSSDWTSVLSGSNSKVYLSVLQYDTANNAVSIFEASAVAAQYKEFAANPWEAFYTTGTARATISVNSDYSISFYRDGIKMFTYSKGTTFNDSQYTIADLGKSLENDLKNGTLRAEYSLSNVTIGAPIGQPLAGNMDITLTDANTTLVYTVAGSSAYGTFVPAISNAINKGVAVSFYMSTPITSDWTSVIIQNTSNYVYKVSLPNLDTSNGAWNKFPASNNKVGGEWDSFLNRVGFVTVSINSDHTVAFYLNGAKMIEYYDTDGPGNLGTGTVSEFVGNLLWQLQYSNGFYFANGVPGAEDLIVTNALTGAQVGQLFRDYKEYAPDNIQEKQYDFKDETIKVHYAPTNTLIRTGIAAVPDAINEGFALSFDLTKAQTSDWDSIVIWSNIYKISLPNLDSWFSTGTMSEKHHWPSESNFNASYNYDCTDDLRYRVFLDCNAYVTISVTPGDSAQKTGKITYYKNGEKVVEYYGSDDYNYDGDTLYVQDFIDELLYSVENNGFGFGCDTFEAQNVIVTNALNDTQAKDNVYANKGDTLPYDCAKDGHVYDSAKSGSACTGFTVTYTCRYCSDSYQTQTLEGVTGHNYELTADVASTCTTHGYVTYKCSVCGDEVTAEKPLAAHTVGDTWEYGEIEIDGVLTKAHWKECSVCQEKAGLSAHVRTEIITKYPTCTEEGRKTVGCTICDYEEIVPIEKTAHSSTGEWQGNDESHWKVCDSCGQNVVSNEAHTYGEWVTVTEATCHSDGLQQRTCSVCNYVQSKTIPSSTVPHNVADVWSYDDNYHYHACTNDGCTYTEDKTPHNWIETSRDDATCESDGMIYYSCECGATKTEKIDALGHKPAANYSIDSTGHWYECENGCGEKLDYAEHNVATLWSSDENSHWHECTDGCGYKTEVAAHDWDDGVITKPATADQTGIKMFTCNTCERTKEVTITSDGHEAAADWQYDEDYHWHNCATAGCNEVFDKGTHTFDGGVVTTPATCTENGLRTYTCTVCHYYYTEVINATGHDMIHHTAVPATCTVNGTLEYWSCENCDKNFADAQGMVELDDIVDYATGHVKADNMSYDSSSHWYECTVCHEKLEEEAHTIVQGEYESDADSHWQICADGCGYSTAKQSHNWIATGNTTEPTCTENGGTEYRCSVCGKTKSEGVSATGHDMTHHVEVPAACESDGSCEYWTCGNCGKNFADENGDEEITQTVVPALGHDYVFSKTVAPDFDAKTDGYDLYVCGNDPSHTEKRNTVEWESLGVTLSFNVNGGSSVSSQFVEKGTALKLTVPTKSGCTFGGWYTDSAFKNKVSSDSYMVNSNTTLYARWLVTVVETEDDEEVEIKVESPSGFDEDVKVSVVDKTETQHGITVENGKVDKVYEVSINAEVNGEITVSIYVGTNFDSANCNVYKADNDGELTQVEYAYSDGYVTLSTSELGTFVFSSPVSDGGNAGIVPQPEDGNGVVIAVCVVCAVIAIAAIAAVVVVAVRKKRAA